MNTPDRPRELAAKALEDVLRVMDLAPPRRSELETMGMIIAQAIRAFAIEQLEEVKLKVAERGDDGNHGA